MLLAKKMPGISGVGLMNDRFSADDLPRRPGSASLTVWPIDLAHVRLFRLGGVEVRPATREIVGDDRREMIEPLVMQVLVVLARARGEILSRDDLIDACWGGRAVSDDALNRVLSRLRALGRTFGSFEIETITKVGYRLVEDGAEQPSVAGASPAGTNAHRASAMGRRALIAGGAALAVAGTGAVLWTQPWRHRPPVEAVDYFRRGEIAQRQGFSGQARQAISFYEQAVRIDPLYSDAWGALALAITHVMEGYGQAETRALPGRLVSAAQRALRLDPGNADAQLALILIKPSFRNWRNMEGRLRQFNTGHPDHWLGIGRLGTLLFDVGRIDEGIRSHQRLQQIDPLLPVGQAYLANAMLSAGRLEGAEALLEAARERWPGHPSLWTMTYRLLLYSGRPQAAGAFAMEPDYRPDEMKAEDVAAFARLAQAIDRRQPGDIEASVGYLTRRAEADVHSIPSSAPIFALLGRADLTFRAWDRYLLNRGDFGLPTPIEPYTRRYTRELFSLPMAPLRADPRFAQLMQRIGLEDYWRQTGSRPDYRRQT